MYSRRKLLFQKAEKAYIEDLDVKSFSNVTDAYCRLIDWQSKAEFCKYKLNESGQKKACLMCYFFLFFFKILSEESFVFVFK